MAMYFVEQQVADGLGHTFLDQLARELRVLALAHVRSFLQGGHPVHDQARRGFHDAVRILVCIQQERTIPRS